MTVFGEEVYAEVSNYLQSRKQLDYIISCWEVCPTTGRPHYHIYCHFINSVQLSEKKCFHSHLEIVRGSVDDNIHYIKKTGKHKSEFNDDPTHHKNLLEWGTIPKESGGRLTAHELMSMSTAEIVEFDPRCHKAYLGAKNMLLNPVDIDIDDWAKVVTVYYIQGPSGVGKTTKAMDMVRENYPVGQRTVNIVSYTSGGFWEGVGLANVALYDEWRSSHMKPSEFIRFIDYNKQNMNVKGGIARNNYTTIFITSVERLKAIYGNVGGEPRLQWERRIKLIDMYADASDEEN
nr:putative replication associated protein [Crucivirus sp.]